MNTERIHRTIAGTGLVLGSAAFTGADLLRRVVEPPGNDPTAITAAVRGSYGLWVAAGLLAAAAAFLMLPGAVAAMRLAPARGATLTVLGGYLVGAGLLASVAHLTEYYGQYGLLAKTGVADSVVTDLEVASPLSTVLIVLFVVGMLVGPLLLTIGLRRARVVPVWVPLAAVVFVVCANVGGLAAGVVGLLAALASLGVVGVAVLRSGAPRAERRSTATVATDLVTP